MQTLQINILEIFKHHRNRTQHAVLMVFEFFKNIDFQSVKKFQVFYFLCISIGAVKGLTVLLLLTSPAYLCRAWLASWCGLLSADLFTSTSSSGGVMARGERRCAGGVSGGVPATGEMFLMQEILFNRFARIFFDYCIP